VVTLGFLLDDFCRAVRHLSGQAAARVLALTKFANVQIALANARGRVGRPEV